MGSALPTIDLRPLHGPPSPARDSADRALIEQLRTFGVRRPAICHGPFD